MNSIKCPNCGSNLNIIGDRSLFFCEYCGARITSNNGKISYEIVQRIVDEARIKEAEVEMQRVKNSGREKSELRRVLSLLLLSAGFMLIIVLAFKFI